MSIAAPTQPPVGAAPSTSLRLAGSAGRRSKPCALCERIRQGSGAWFLRGGKSKPPTPPTAPPSGKGKGTGAGQRVSRWHLLGLLVLAGLALQLYFVFRVALMVVVDPQSTAFERSNLWRLNVAERTEAGAPPPWQQQWVPYEQISSHLKRAVIASEDSRFTEHTGVEWEAIEKAWERNAQAMEAAADQAEAKRPARAVRILGGSTLTQQLAKNLFLSGERTLLRKGQELVLTQLLELMLSKERILELYLNHAEWGRGVFGAEAAARHYFKKSASALSAQEAARLAVMLPRPKFFEARPKSSYLRSQTQRIVARMRHVTLPD